MGACLYACCCSETGTRCWNIVSVLGFIYFGLTFLIFDRQKNYFQFYMENPDDTKLSCIISAGIYVLIFLYTLFKLHRFNQKKEAKKHKHSIHEEAVQMGSLKKSLKKQKSMKEQESARELMVEDEK